jgi:lipocalin
LKKGVAPQPQHQVDLKEYWGKWFEKYSFMNPEPVVKGVYSSV